MFLSASGAVVAHKRKAVMAKCGVQSEHTCVEGDGGWLVGDERTNILFNSILVLPSGTDQPCALYVVRRTAPSTSRGTLDGCSGHHRPTAGILVEEGALRRLQQQCGRHRDDERLADSSKALPNWSTKTKNHTLLY